MLSGHVMYLVYTGLALFCEILKKIVLSYVVCIV